MSKRSKRAKRAEAVQASAPESALPSWVFPIAVAAIVFVVFLPALRNDFVSWDDEHNFLENPHYRGLGLSNLHWMWTTFHLGHYVPLSWMTLGLDYKLWGMDPAGYHATSVLIHAVNSALLFLLARQLFRRAIPAAARRTTDWAAAFSALVFALHPLRVESVVWITERRDVLSLFFYLASVMAWLRSVSDETHRARFYWAAVALFLCALLSKATAMTLPAVLLLLDVYPLRRLTASNWRDVRSAQTRAIYLEILPFALLSLGFIILSIVALHPPAQLSFGAKIAVSAYSLCFYLLKSFVPTGLSPLYQMPEHVDPFDGVYIACYAVVVALIVGAVMLRKRMPGLVAGFVGFVLISLPMLGIVQNGPQIAADRYTYHSAPALALLAGAALFLVLQLPQWTRFTLGGVVLAALTIATFGQTYVWHDSEVLWGRVIQVEPMSSLGHSGYASLLFQEDRVPEGLDHARRAVEFGPNLPEAHNDLGVGLTRTDDPAGGIKEYQRALALKPSDEEAENNWGVADAQLGNLADARKHYERAIELRPDYADAHVNLGNLLVRELKQAEAIPHYAEALRIRPDEADAHFNWGVALAQQGKYDDAIAHFRDAIELRPNFELAKQYIERATRLKAAKQDSVASAASR